MLAEGWNACICGWSRVAATAAGDATGELTGELIEEVPGIE